MIGYFLVDLGIPDSPFVRTKGTSETFKNLADKAMKKVISAWCSSDRNKSFSSLKQGKKIKTLECENPINEHKDMINLIGVGPTPAIFLQNGEAISGYKPYDEILAILREKN